MYKVLTVLVLSSLTAAYAYASCPFAETCPIDGQAMYCVSTDYSGIHQIKTFAHTTIQGNVHRMTVACN